MKNSIPYKTIHRMMKENADECKIGKDAVEQVIFFMDNLVEDITVICNEYAKHDGRKTITSKDINFAIETIFN